MIVIRNLLPVVWRELKVDLNSIGRKINYFLNPMLILILYAVAFSVHADKVPYMNKQVEFTTFFVPGLVTFQVFAMFSITFSRVRTDMLSNVVNTIALSNVPIKNYYFGVLLVGTVETFLRILFLIVLAHFLFGTVVPMNLVTIAIISLYIIVGCCMWYSVGFICGILIANEEIRDIFFSLLVLPISFASSLYYNIDYAPTTLKTIAKVNPLTYNCDVIREAFIMPHPHLWQNYLILSFVSVALVMFGSIKTLRFATT